MEKFLEDFDDLYHLLPMEIIEEIEKSLEWKIENLLDWYGQKHEIFFTEDEKNTLKNKIKKQYFEKILSLTNYKND